MLEFDRTDPHFELIYGRHAADYHELVSREDWKGNLPKALVEAASFDGRTVVELGAGTGRLTQLLASWSARVLAFERFEVGAGIEKKQDDFVAEVMAQVKGAGPATVRH